jgi:PAS domain-containing protein
MLHAFPSRDREFLDFAQVAFKALPEPRTTDALQRAIRIRYPAAVVTEQAELARHGDGPLVWYAFRTAAIGILPIGTEVDESEAWAIIDDEMRFLEVSQALAKIVEQPARRMLGRRIEAFSNPEDPTVREDIGRLWAEFRDGGAISSTVRFNYLDGRPRELAYRLTANEDGEGRHRLIVKVLAPSA